MWKTAIGQRTSSNVKVHIYERTVAPQLVIIGSSTFRNDRRSPCASGLVVTVSRSTTMDYFKHDSKRRMLLLHRNIRRMNEQTTRGALPLSKHNEKMTKLWSSSSQIVDCDRWQLYWYLILDRVWDMAFYRSLDVSKTFRTRTREATFQNVRRSACAWAVYYHWQEHHLLSYPPSWAAIAQCLLF